MEYPDVVSLDTLRECLKRWQRERRFARVMGDIKAAEYARRMVRLYDKRIARVAGWNEKQGGLKA